MPAMLVTVGVAVVSKALSGMINWFSPSNVYERRRLNDRKEEIEKAARIWEDRIVTATVKISANPSRELGYAILQYKDFRQSEDSYAKWTPQGRNTWTPHTKFDYPSAKVGAYGRWAVVSEACKRMERFLAQTYPTYGWDFKFVKVSPEEKQSEEREVVGKDMLSKMAIPLGLLGLSILSSK